MSGFQENLEIVKNRPASEVPVSRVPIVSKPNVLKGRRKILTSYINQSQHRQGMYGAIVLNKDNVHLAVNEAMEVHVDNAREIEYLLNYYEGEQTILNRVKDVREDVNNKLVLNYANSFTRDIVGYTFGKPMQYVAEGNDEKIKEDVKTICETIRMAGKSKSDQIKAMNASICGISHRGVFKNKYDNDDDESSIIYADLDSRTTFVALSNQLGEEPVFAVTYKDVRTDKKDEWKRIFTVYTKDEIYMYDVPTVNHIIGANLTSGTVISKDNLVSGFPISNPINEVPIVECLNNNFRMGHWETAISVIDALNKLASDSVNDVEQFVNSILVAVNAEFSEEDMKNVRENKYAEIKSPQGLNADLKYISNQLDGASVEQLRQYLEDSLRVIVGIPDRKGRGGGGGDTGDAVKLRDGWSDIETVAQTTEMFNKDSERKELKIILKILKSLKKVNKASMINIDIKYPRNKTDNLSTKTQAMATLHNMRILAPQDILEVGDITTDIDEVIERGKQYWQEQKEQQVEDQRVQLEMQKEFSAQTGVNGGTQKGELNAESKPNGTAKSNGKPTNNGERKPKPKSKPDK